ncbi:hypothetical protein [Brevundimonas sp.]|uniref:hypothetical protein n=1 Tax=Brevundimonas sp. TaxID=1871086 RepID=UPI003566BF1C
MHHSRSTLSQGLHNDAWRGNLGEVSADFGGNTTTIHLRFEIKIPVTSGGGAVVAFVPSCSSLVDSYGRLLNGAA